MMVLHYIQEVELTSTLNHHSDHRQRSTIHLSNRHWHFLLHRSALLPCDLSRKNSISNGIILYMYIKCYISNQLNQVVLQHISSRIRICLFSFSISKVTSLLNLKNEVNLTSIQPTELGSLTRLDLDQARSD